ncbi:MAG TPA: hypothetical protein VMZ66_04850 [Aeromicrobium sp.]|nr:hypothetical protein [Aeromicrobium sp.]
MSRSNPEPPSVRLFAQAGSDSEVFVIDHAFQLVARAVGPLDVQVSPGIYKVKFRRGTTVRETTTIVSGPSDVEVAVPADLGSPDVAASQPEVQAMASPAPDRPKRVSARPAPGGELVLDLRLGAAGAHPAEGLTVHDASGALLTDVRRECPLPQPPSPTLACAVSLRPGAYRLRLARGPFGTIEQSIAICDKWQTRLSATAIDLGTSSAPLWRADLANATLMMGPIGQQPSTETLRYADTVKSWLAGPQSTIATAHAERLAGTPIADPLFAISVAHTLVRQSMIDREFGKTPSKDQRALVARLVAQLETLVPGHPDLASLALWLTPQRTIAFALPPMLRSSWAIIVAASVRRPAIVPAGSLSALMAEHLWGSQTWLAWRFDLLGAPAESAPKRSRSSLFQAVVQAAGALGTMPSSVTDLERAVLTRLQGLDTGDSAPITKKLRVVSAQLARGVGVPMASVDRAASSLLAKLSRGTE